LAQLSHIGGKTKIMDTTKQYRIFLVDDDIFCLNLTEQHIRNLGNTDITVFESGTDCLNHLESKPDIIFLDHQMDTLTGFEVLKKIKRFNPNIYVVMLSAQENMKTAVDSLKYGAFDYLIKGDNQEEKISDVLTRINEVQTLLKKSKPSFFRMLVSVI
jgi:DNA-binding NtrC family response regulator